MRIAIVGSGISGLVSAHLLHRDHEITVFEADDRIGGHTHTVDVEVDGRHHAVDTGFIVYNDRTYHGFCRLMDELGVETQPSEMSFSLSCDRSGVEWGSRGLLSVLAQPSNLLRSSFRGMLKDVVRFRRDARDLIISGDEKVSLGDYLVGAGYSQAFMDHYIVPMGAAIWSASPADLPDFPALSFARFFDNHGLLDLDGTVQWRVIKGGSNRYTEALIRPFRDRIFTNCGVNQILRTQDRVALTTSDGSVQHFDKVILALHSNQALRILGDPSEAEREILGAIRYQPNEVVLHTDASLMPTRRRAWASWNYRTPERKSDRVFVTYHMNRLQSLETETDFFVTLNAADRIDPNKVLARFEYDHPMFDGHALAAQKMHGALDGIRNTHYCGAYWGYGFHEDGVQSALSVCRKFGKEL